MEDQKNYLLEQYRLAISNFKVASSEDEQWNARKEMARIEWTAIELCGDELTPQFEKMKDEIR